MNLFNIAQLLHIVGIAWGVGGVTAISLLNMQADKHPELSPLQMKVLPIFSKLIGFGMLLLVISGIILGRELGGTVDKTVFPIKIILVIALIINGLYLSFRLMPKMEKLAPAGGPPSGEFLKVKQQTKIAGMIGLVLWYAILVLGVLL